MQDKNIEEAVNYFKSRKFIIAEKKVVELIKKFPNNYTLYNLLGSIFVGKRNLYKAVINYKKSIQINPDYAVGYNNLAVIFIQLRKFNESIDSCQRAIQINPDFAKAYNNLGIAFYGLEKLNKSIDSYQQAIRISPNYAEAHKNLGSLFRSIGNIDDARKCFNKLFNLKPDNIEYKINSELLISPIAQSIEEINFYRSEYEKGLQSLKQYKYITEQPGLLIESNPFYLSYHNKNNLEIMRKTSGLFRQMMPNINYVSKNIKNKKKTIIRIGFISAYLTNHTVGKLFGGLIKNLDRKKFEIIIFHTIQRKKNSMKNKIDDSANKVINLSTKIQEQQQQVEKENLDIVFYPEIGMSATTYFLAFSRFAPVQIVGFGHPETTGINTIDYFLSSTLFETNDIKRKQHSERLIYLSQFPSYYEPPKNLGRMKNRKDLKLPENVRLYGCPQTLFKLHPDFDAILAKILVQDPKGYIVLIGSEGKLKYWSEALKKRWSKNFSILNERVLFTKSLSLLEFISLCDCVDVLLDPLHFGGGNSFLEAMIVGTPSVTMPGIYLKANVTAAAYKQMKILTPPVVQSSEEYVNLAISLAQDGKKNRSLRKESKIAANKYLYNNSKVLNKFEQFFEEAHLAAQQGNKLKDGCIF